MDKLLKLLNHIDEIFKLIFVHHFHYIIALMVIILTAKLIHYIIMPLYVQGTKFIDSNYPYNINIPKIKNTWIPIINSSEVTKEVKHLTIFNENLVVFRGNSQKVYVLNAYCPHLGANFSSGGKSICYKNEECIECPFHQWKFRANDGVCMSVPYAKNEKPPAGVKVKSWKAIEYYGYVYIWMDENGNEPQWYLPEIKELENNDYKFYGRTIDHINCRLSEILENAADIFHFQSIHKTSPIYNLSFYLNTFLQHHWEATYSPCEAPYSHNAIVKISNVSSLGGFDILKGVYNIVQVGTAIVKMNFDMKILGFSFKGIILQINMPLKSTHIKTHHDVYLERNFLSYISAKFLIHSICYLYGCDVKIWNKKMYLKHPTLIKEEKPLRQFRRWKEQFFVEDEFIK